MRTFPTLRLAVTAALASLALVATGCGSTTSSSGGGSTTDTASEDTGAGSDAATGSDTSSGSDSTAGSDTASGSDTTAGVSFATVFPKLKTDCATAGCHTTKDSKFAGKLDLETQDNAYAGLVSSGTADGVCGPMLRVKAGDHANSSLWIRVNPDAKIDCGGGAGKMPAGGTPWTAADAEKIAAWIDGGAAK